MKIKIEFDADALIHDVMANQPEHSAGMVLKCYDWNYKRGTYWFRDTEAMAGPGPSLIKPSIRNLDLKHGPVKGATVYVVRMGDLRRAMRLAAQEYMSGNWNGPSAAFMDPGSWDSECGDALVQYAIFGKLVYG